MNAATLYAQVVERLAPAAASSEDAFSEFLVELDHATAIALAAIEGEFAGLPSSKSEAPRS